MRRAIATETLYALMSHADQHLIMIMRVVGMTLEMGVHTLNPRLLVAANVDPVTSDLAIGGMSHMHTYAPVIDAGAVTQTAILLPIEVRVTQRI